MGMGLPTRRPGNRQGELAAAILNCCKALAIPSHRASQHKQIENNTFEPCTTQQSNHQPSHHASCHPCRWVKYRAAHKPVRRYSRLATASHAQTSSTHRGRGVEGTQYDASEVTARTFFFPMAFTTSPT